MVIAKDGGSSNPRAVVDFQEARKKDTFPEYSEGSTGLSIA